MTHPIIQAVTQRMLERSQAARKEFLKRTQHQAAAGKGGKGSLAVTWLMLLRHLVRMKTIHS